ncbi:MAG: response regulator [Candidatus Moranbacteria bacterium]|nr:response regulator [Candidatus Moranbacteria bacterium]
MENKKIILIIEDDESLLEVLGQGVSDSGFKVLKAKNGADGLEMAVENKPDLILLDLIMPKMDGLTMLDKLREDEWGKDVPVIVLTNLSSPEEISKTVDKGVSNYLVKSNWKLEEILKKVKQVLEEE